MEPTTTNTQEQAAPAAELSISDLQNLRAIVEVAVKRGTFAAAELSSVGAVYDRVSNFLNAVTPAKAPEEANQESTV